MAGARESVAIVCGCTPNNFVMTSHLAINSNWGSICVWGGSCDCAVVSWDPGAGRGMCDSPIQDLLEGFTSEVLVGSIFTDAWVFPTAVISYHVAV